MGKKRFGAVVLCVAQLWESEQVLLLQGRSPVTSG